MRVWLAQYGLSTLISLMLHGVLLFFLYQQFRLGGAPAAPQISQQPQPQIIDAVAIEQSALDNELQRLADIAEAKRQAEIARAKAAEQARLAKLREQQERERQRKAKQEQQRLAKARAEQAAKEAAEQAAREAELAQQRLAEEQAATAKVQAEAEKLAEQRLAKLRAQEAQEQREAARLAQQQQQRARQRVIASEVSRYGSMVRQKVARHWSVQGASDGSACRLKVRLAPGGVVLDVNIESTSGNEALDRSCVSAVYKASPLPVPSDPEVFESFREILFTLRPDEIVRQG